MRTAILNFGVFLFLWGSFLSGGEAYSEDLSNPLSRYTREFVEDENLAHWSTPVFFQILGKNVDEASFHAASLVSYYAENSGVEMQILGDRSRWFSPKAQISPNANFILVFEDLTRLPIGEHGKKLLEELGLSIQGENPALSKLVSGGIQSLGPGCFGDWLVEPGNEIVANIHIVDTSMPDHVQKECIKYGAVSAFGVHYTVNTFTFADIPGRNTPAVFLDESELVLLLRAASFCRKEVGDFSTECPKRVLYGTYKFHNEVLNK